MQIDAGPGVRRVGASAAGHRGAGLGVVHHRAGDLPLRLPDARRRAAQRARRLRDQRPQLQLRRHRAASASPATTTAASCCSSTATASTTTCSARPRSAPSSASTRPCSSGSRSSAVRRRRSTATARSSRWSTSSPGRARRSTARRSTVENGTLGTQLVRVEQRAGGCRTVSTWRSPAPTSTATACSRLFFPAFDTPRHEQRHRRRARRRRREAVLRPHDLQGA